MALKVLLGDAAQTLATLPAGLAQTCITSPPYWGLRDYGIEGQIGHEATPEAYIAALRPVFREVFRVLADDGTLWLNIGDSYLTIPHGPKGVNAPQRFGNKGHAGRGQGRTGSAVADTATYANRKPIPGYKHKDLIGIPWMLAFALRADGWTLRQDIIWAKPVHRPESVSDRCTRAHEYLFLLAKGPNYKFLRLRDGSRNQPSVWSINPTRVRTSHVAPFPEALVSRCVEAGTTPGDVVLDPFGGSGTTGRVAQRMGRHAVLCELHPEYAKECAGGHDEAGSR